MANDVMSGMWKQLKGEVKEHWGKLTDNDLQEIQGNKEKLVGKLQERYGYSKEEAQGQVAQFLDNMRNSGSQTRNTGF